MLKALVLVILLLFVCYPTSAQEKAPTPCPSISVSGPAGVPSFGESLSFVATVNGQIPRGVTYLWRVSNGAIIGGQGTVAITVGNWTAGDNVTATLEIVGLANVCPNTASESAPVCSCLEAILLDEFSVPISKLEKERFKVAVTEQKNNPTNQLHIIEYYNDTAQFAIREKVRRLTEFLVKEIKLDENYFEIVTHKSDRPLTKIYRIPPGAATPKP